MKNKLLTGLLASGALLMSASPVLAAGTYTTQDIEHGTDVGATPITVTVSPSYTVTIPQEIDTVRDPFDLQDVEFEVGASNVVLTHNKALQVSVDESVIGSVEGAELNLGGASVVFESPNATLPNQWMALTFTEDKAPAGTYDNTLQFTIAEVAAQQ